MFRTRMQVISGSILGADLTTIIQNFSFSQYLHLETGIINILEYNLCCFPTRISSQTTKKLYQKTSLNKIINSPLPISDVWPERGQCSRYFFRMTVAKQYILIDM